MLGLYARCVFHMRPSQAAWFLWRRGLGLQGGAPGAAAPSLRRRVSIGPRLGPPTLQPAPWSLRFLNATRAFPAGAIDWVCSDAPKLWRYNLHYHDFLHDPAYGADPGAPKYDYSRLFNDAWARPGREETVSHASRVEGGCYW